MANGGSTMTATALPNRRSSQNRSLSPVPRVRRRDRMSSSTNTSPTAASASTATTRNGRVSRLPARVNSYGGSASSSKTNRLPLRVNSYGGPASSSSNNISKLKPRLLVDYSKKRADLRGKGFSQSDRTLNIRRTQSLEYERSPLNRQHYLRSSAPVTGQPQNQQMARAHSEHNHESSASVDWNKLSNELEWEEQSNHTQGAVKHGKFPQPPPPLAASCSDLLRQSFLTKPLGMSHSHLLGTDFHFQKEQEMLQNVGTITIPTKQENGPENNEEEGGAGDVMNSSSHHTITIHSSRRESMNLRRRKSKENLQRSRSVSPVRSSSSNRSAASPKRTSSLSPIKRPSAVKKRIVSNTGPPPFNHMGLQSAENTAFKGSGSGSGSEGKKQEGKNQQTVGNQQTAPLGRSATTPINRPQPPQQQQNRPLLRSGTSPIRTKPTIVRRTVSGGPPPHNHLGLKISDKPLVDDSEMEESMRLGDVFGGDNSMGNHSGPTANQGSSVRREQAHNNQQEGKGEGKVPMDNSSTRRHRTARNWASMGNNSPQQTKGGGAQQQRQPAANRINKWASMGSIASPITRRSPSPNSSKRGGAQAAKNWGRTNSSMSGGEDTKSTASRESTEDETDVLIKKLTQEPAAPTNTMGRLYKSMSTTLSAFKSAVNPLKDSNNKTTTKTPTAPVQNNTNKKSSAATEKMDDISSITNETGTVHTAASLSFPRKPSQHHSPNGGKKDKLSSSSSRGGKKSKSSNHKPQHLGGTLGLQPWDDEFNNSLSSMSSHWESMDDDSYQREQDRRESQETNNAVVAKRNSRKSSLTLGDDETEKEEKEDEDLLFLPAPTTAPPKRTASGRVLNGSNHAATGAGAAATAAAAAPSSPTATIPKGSGSGRLLRGSSHGPKRTASGRSLKGSRDEDLKVPPSRTPSERSLRGSSHHRTPSERSLRGSSHHRRTPSPPPLPPPPPPPPTAMPKRSASSGTLGLRGSSTTRSSRRNSNTRKSNTTNNSKAHRRSLSDSGSSLNASGRMGGSGRLGNSSRMGNSSRIANSRRRKSDSGLDNSESMRFALRRTNSGHGDKKLHGSMTGSMTSVRSASERQQQSDSTLMFGTDNDYLDEEEKKRQLRDRLVRSNSSFRKNQKLKELNNKRHHHGSDGEGTPSRSNPHSRSNTPSPNTSNRRMNLQKELSVNHLESEYDRFTRKNLMEHLKKTQSTRSVSPPRRNAALLMRADSNPRNLGQQRPPPVKAASSSELFSPNRHHAHHHQHVNNSSNANWNGRPEPSKAAASSHLMSTRRNAPQQVMGATTPTTSSATKGIKPPFHHKVNEMLSSWNTRPADPSKAASLSQMGTPRRPAIPPTTWIRNKIHSASALAGGGTGIRGGRGMEKQGSSRRGLVKQGSSRRGRLATTSTKPSSSRNIRSASPSPSAGAGARSTSPHGRRNKPTTTRKSMSRSRSLDEQEWAQQKKKSAPAGFRESMLRQASFVTGSRIRRLNQTFNNSIANLNASFSPSHGPKHDGMKHHSSTSHLNYSVPNINYS